MLDDELDNIIRDAAANHHPAYDNKAWDKMKVLLEEHLPQKKNKRRFLWLWLAMLLLGIGGYWTFNHYSANKKQVATNPQKANNSLPANLIKTGNADTNVATATNTNTNSTSNTDPRSNTNPASNTDQASSTNISSGPDANPNTSFNSNPDKFGKSNSTHAVNIPKQKTPSGRFAVSNSAARTAVTVLNSAAEEFNGLTPNQPVNENSNSKAADKKDEQLKNNALSNPDLIAKTSENKAEEKKAEEKKPGEKKDNITVKQESSKKQNKKTSLLGNLGFIISGGPDISMVEVKKPGKVTLSYGVGLGYTFKNKLTIQTGFYVANKIYSADSSEYHPTGPVWIYYPYVNNIDANCKVFEIPVNLLYNFGKKGKHNWYAGAGISSVFMKSEVYDYSYDYFGQTYKDQTVIKNENQHNFSMLGLTAGYQYNISNRVSLSAQPYVKLPLKGIGFGKVELKSGGVLMNLTVKPFAKKH